MPSLVKKSCLHNDEFAPKAPARIPDGQYHTEEEKQIEEECLDEKHHQVLKHEITSDGEVVKSESWSLASDSMDGLVDSLDSLDSVDLS